MHVAFYGRSAHIPSRHSGQREVASLGNKVDVDGGSSRVVSKKKATTWCASKGDVPYYETSAKEDINIDAAFQCIAKNALKNEVEEEIYIPDTIDVNAKANVSKSSGCC